MKLVLFFCSLSRGTRCNHLREGPSEKEYHFKREGHVGKTQRVSTGISQRGLRIDDEG